MNTDKITKALCEICKAATNNDHSAPDWFEKLKDAENTLKAVDDILSFNEYERECGDSDNALEEMEYLDELAQCGGDWSKPSYILMRAFYGHRYSRFANENFNPNDEYLLLTDTAILYQSMSLTGQITGRQSLMKVDILNTQKEKDTLRKSLKCWVLRTKTTKPTRTRSNPRPSPKERYKMKINIVENIPQWAVSYIAYGDDSGITKEEKSMIDAFILSLNNDGWQICETPISGSENGFCRFPAFGDACATVDFEIYKN